MINPMMQVKRVLGEENIVYYQRLTERHITMNSYYDIELDGYAISYYVEGLSYDKTSSSSEYFELYYDKSENNWRAIDNFIFIGCLEEVLNNIKVYYENLKHMPSD